MENPGPTPRSSRTGVRSDASALATRNDFGVSESNTPNPFQQQQYFSKSPSNPASARRIPLCLGDIGVVPRWSHRFAALICSRHRATHRGRRGRDHPTTGTVGCGSQGDSPSACANRDPRHTVGGDRHDGSDRHRRLLVVLDRPTVTGDHRRSPTRRSMGYGL